MNSEDQPTGPDGLPRSWTIEFYEDEYGEKPVLNWIRNDLSPTKRRALGTAMRRILQQYGVGVCSTNWGDQVATGLMEFRVRMRGSEVINIEAEINEVTAAVAAQRFDLNASEDILLRVFFAPRGEKLVLLLHGYDKGEDTSKKRQQNEIRTAQARLTALDEREARAKKIAKRGRTGRA